MPFCYLQKLRLAWSKRFGKLAKDIFISSVSAHSNVSAQCCEELWGNLERDLAEQLQQAEGDMKLQLESMTAQLNKDEKVANGLANVSRILFKPRCFSFFCRCGVKRWLWWRTV